MKYVCYHTVITHVHTGEVYHYFGRHIDTGAEYYGSGDFIKSCKNDNKNGLSNKIWNLSVEYLKLLIALKNVNYTKSSWLLEVKTSMAINVLIFSQAVFLG